ncbi:hypothetical protein ABT340_39825 [Streptosporangium sp. NPDC000239]|uniref:hypothetical protein n=1 Tax=Streptosporangium sp. NPDC000239 TaxID=3154248 RepID=UPI003332C15A
MTTSTHDKVMARVLDQARQEFPAVKFGRGDLGTWTAVVGSGVLTATSVSRLLAQLRLKEELAADHPGWSIWISDGGRWYATRRAELTKPEIDAGCARTVEAEGPGGLAEGLEDQTRRSEGTA